MQCSLRTQGQVELRGLRLQPMSVSEQALPTHSQGATSWPLSLGRCAGRETATARAKDHCGKEVGCGPALAIFVSTGFGDRLLSEVKKLAPKDVKIKVRLKPSGAVGAGWGGGTPAEPVPSCTVSDHP